MREREAQLSLAVRQWGRRYVSTVDPPVSYSPELPLRRWDIRQAIISLSLSLSLLYRCLAITGPGLRSPVSLPWSTSGTAMLMSDHSSWVKWEHHFVSSSCLSGERMCGRRGLERYVKGYRQIRSDLEKKREELANNQNPAQYHLRENFIKVEFYKPVVATR